MGLLIVLVSGIAVAGTVAFVVFSQPRPVWQDSAEHSRWFWFAWIAVSVAVGVAPAAAGVVSDGVAAVWLTACCAFAALQPALWTDVLEVRRDVARRRRVLLEKRESEEARVEAGRVR
ncbi:MAG: hypothetical protein WEA75_13105 [Acidimicrobiia bacterium]